MQGKYPKRVESNKYELSDGSIVKRHLNAERKQREIYRQNAKFTAVFKKCQQIGPEDFETSFETKQLTPGTTIRELQEWFASKSKGRMNININEEWSDNQ